jgi:hypothetical protein
MNTEEPVMHKAGWKQRGVSLPRTASALAVATMLACSGVSGLAEELRIEQSTVETRAGTGKWAELEKTFWMCDHAAIKGMIDVNQAVVCGAITDELRREKFDGDFDKLLTWWRLNKAAEHQKLDQAHIAEFDRYRTSIPA